MTRAKHVFIYLLFAVLILCGKVFSQNKIIGTWNGELEIDNNKYKAVFHIKESEDGSFYGTMDSPDQGAFGIKLDEVTFSNGELYLSHKNMRMTYKALIKDDGNTLEGTFSQNGMDIPLNLEKDVAETSEEKESQESEEPVPYKVEEVEIYNKDADIKLSGTFTIPANKEKPAVAVLITGSGPQNRDEEIFGHKPFAVLADHLTRKGIAVLRYDDRGVGESEGNFGEAVPTDFASDVIAAVDYLKSREDIDSKKIGLIGHSEGGIIAPMVASKNKDIAYTVFMAGPGVNMPEVLVTQDSLISLAFGKDKEILAKALKKQREILNLVKEADVDKNRDQLKKMISERFEIYGEPTDDDVVENEIAEYKKPWLRFYMNYDVQNVLSKVKCPVLAINGELDVQVYYKDNLQGIEKSLKKAGNNDFLVKSFPKLNHLFQTAETGSPVEYNRINETISPIVLDEISNWINKRF
ncbi:MAG: alpha/beta fold hydrolase [Ignavibacteria bacterium]|jgi:hypothetical protein